MWHSVLTVAQYVAFVFLLSGWETSSGLTWKFLYRCVVNSEIGFLDKEDVFHPVVTADVRTDEESESQQLSEGGETGERFPSWELLRQRSATAGVKNWNGQTRPFFTDKQIALFIGIN